MTKSMASMHQVETSGEFTVHVLSNSFVSLRMVPELGGRIVSLVDREAKREWLDGWEQEEERRLWHPSDPHDYDTGPGAGLDECLPTVLADQLGEVTIPDHGEVWRTAPDFEVENQALKCCWQLDCLPLTFERRVFLEGDTVRMSYRLHNRSTSKTPFLWAWHPLFRIEKGDQFIFEPTLTSCVTPEGEMQAWPSPRPGQDLTRADIGTAQPPAAKVFLGPMTTGQAAIHSTTHGLELEWPADLFPWAGIWISRGAWKGLHHWAIEPTNAPVDFISQAPAHEHAFLEGDQAIEWELSLRLISRRNRKSIFPTISGPKTTNRR